MDRRTLLSARLMLVGCLTLFAFAGCSGIGGTNPPSAMSPAVGSTRGVPAYLPTRFVVPATTSGDPLSYYGGPVLVHPKAYVIFWGYKKYGDPDQVAKLLEQYFGAIGGSRHNAIYTQYYEIVSGQKTYITNRKNQAGGFWDDEQHPVPKAPTDAQVAQEALYGVAKFGFDADGSYIVATPHGRNTAGFGTEFCAYHDDVADGSNHVSYTDLPYIPDAGASCGAGYLSPPKGEKSGNEGVTIIEGNEYGFSVIDPIPGTGWYGVGGEGECAWVGVANDRFGKHSFATGSMPSDASQSCVQYYKR